MATTQQVLSAITNMQENAQAALPVIPNNGNPAGANNMPQQPQQEPAPRGPDLSWLGPSPYMQQFTQMLVKRQQLLDNQMAAIQPPQPQPMAAQPNQVVLPQGTF